MLAKNMATCYGDRENLGRSFLFVGPCIWSIASGCHGHNPISESLSPTLRKRQSSTFWPLPPSRRCDDCPLQMNFQRRVRKSWRDVRDCLFRLGPGDAKCSIRVTCESRSDEISVNAVNCTKDEICAHKSWMLSEKRSISPLVLDTVQADSAILSCSMLLPRIQTSSIAFAPPSSPSSIVTI